MDCVIEPSPTIPNIAQGGCVILYTFRRKLVDNLLCLCIGKMQVQEGLVRLSKEHLRPEGGLPLSGLAFFSAENFI